MVRKKSVAAITTEASFKGCMLDLEPARQHYASSPFDLFETVQRAIVRDNVGLKRAAMLA